jgi:hypothetical protein
MDTPTKYCELTYLGIQEPLNVFSSLFFIFFAVLAYKKTGNKVLPILLGFVGISSVLWHLSSSDLGDFLDTVSIAIFSLATIYVIFSKVFKRKISLFFALIFLLIISFLLERVSILNGSLVYIFLLLSLLIAGHFYIKQKPSSKRNIIQALLFFSIAIFFRIADSLFCQYIFTGTHFIWHILMAFVGYNLILGLFSMKDEFTI